MRMLQYPMPLNWARSGKMDIQAPAVVLLHITYIYVIDKSLIKSKSLSSREFFQDTPGPTRGYA